MVGVLCSHTSLLIAGLKAPCSRVPNSGVNLEAMLGFCFHVILVCFFSVFLSSSSVHAEPCHIQNDTHTVHFNELLTLIIEKAISEIFTKSKGGGKKKAYGELISFLRTGFLKASASGTVELGTGSSFKGLKE